MMFRLLSVTLMSLFLLTSIVKAEEKITPKQCKQAQKFATYEDWGGPISELDEYKRIAAKCTVFSLYKVKLAAERRYPDNPVLRDKYFIFAIKEILSQGSSSEGGNAEAIALITAANK
jgi:hypothetical protein